MKKTADEITRTSAHLSLVEVVLGSIVHGLKIPFGGHSLSLNQGFFLVRHVQKMKRDQIYESSSRTTSLYKAPIEVSTVAAILKSLSPAGNKIGPMLSISMQGLLFSVGLMVGRASSLGQLLGLLLLSLWAFIQPFLTLYIIHGPQLGRLFDFYSKRIHDEYPLAWTSIGYFLTLLVLIKLSLALLVFLSTKFIDHKTLDDFENKIIQKAVLLNQNKTSGVEKNSSTFNKIIKDLTRPLFLVSMILLFIFLFLTETDYVNIFWLSLRPIAIAIVFFYLVRSDKVHIWLASLSVKNKFLKIIYDKAQMTKNHLDEISQKLN